MPTLYQYKDGRGYYIRSAAGGLMCTYQLSSEGVEYLVDSEGVNDAGHIDVGTLNYLRDNGWAYTYGSGASEIVCDPGLGYEDDLEEDEGFDDEDVGDHFDEEIDTPVASGRRTSAPHFESRPKPVARTERRVRRGDDSVTVPPVTFITDYTRAAAPPLPIPAPNRQPASRGTSPAELSVIVILGFLVILILVVQFWAILIPIAVGGTSPVVFLRLRKRLHAAFPTPPRAEATCLRRMGIDDTPQMHGLLLDGLLALVLLLLLALIIALCMPGLDELYWRWVYP